MESNVKKNISIVLFFSSLLSSYIFGLTFYDSTTGLDWERYYNTLAYFLGFNTEIYDSQGALYFSFVALITKSKLGFLGSNNLNIILNNSIQLANFLIYIIGLTGLIALFRRKEYKLNHILISLSVLNFFPTAFYFRLTMKPEIIGFALLPWAIYSLEIYFKKRELKTFLFSSSIISLLFTQKASITGMVIICFLVIFWEEVKNILHNLNLLISVLICSVLILFENYKTLGIWLFEHPISLYPNLRDKWNNTASLDFFYNVDLKNLIENPFKHLHADSMISITLLDTLSDYFGFFWNHKEVNNYIAYNKLAFTENFLIQNFLSQYISIIFSIFFYFLIAYLFFKKIKDRNYLLFPLAGIFILVLNSLGFPNKNFNPQTGDLFKVHYYSFLIAITFCFILIYIMSKYRYSALLITLIIPVFFLVMGFPKNLDQNTMSGIESRINQSEICKLINPFNQGVCNNKNFNYYNEKNASNHIPKNIESQTKPRTLIFQILVFLLSVFTGFISTERKGQSYPDKK